MIDESEVDSPRAELIAQSTIARSIEVLLAVLESAKPVSAKQLARGLGIKLGSVYHVLGTLREMNLVARQSGGQLVPGRRALLLGDRLHGGSGISDQLTTLLTDLRNRTRETCYISSLVGSEVVLRVGLESPETLRVATIQPGYSEHPHARAAARAIFAFLPEREIKEVFENYHFEQLTPHTIGDFEKLREELHQVRDAGFSVDDAELYEGVCCVAAPFFGADGRPLGSFTVSAPSIRFKKHTARLINLVTQTAERATQIS